MLESMREKQTSMDACLITQLLSSIEHQKQRLGCVYERMRFTSIEMSNKQLSNKYDDENDKTGRILKIVYSNELERAGAAAANLRSQIPNWRSVSATTEPACRKV